jgi:hypothetical protein
VKVGLSDTEENDDEDDDVACEVHQPCPEAAFCVVEAAGEEQSEEHGGDGSGGAAGMAADPVGEAEVEAGHPQRGGWTDGSPSACEEDEAEAELLVGGVDCGKEEREQEERGPVRPGCCVGVAEEEPELFRKAEDDEEDDERGKQGPSDGAETGDSRVGMTCGEEDIFSGEAAADQSACDERGGDEGEQRVDEDLPRERSVLEPDPVMLDGSFQPTAGEEGDEGDDEAAKKAAGGERKRDEKQGSQKDEDQGETLAGVELPADVRCIAGDENRCPRDPCRSAIQRCILQPSKEDRDCRARCCRDYLLLHLWMKMFFRWCGDVPGRLR